MATLTVRDIDPTMKARLRMRAARHGRSVETELRSILTAALANDPGGEPNLSEAIRRRFAALGGVELDPHPSVPVGTPPAFDP